MLLHIFELASKAQWHQLFWCGWEGAHSAEEPAGNVWIVPCWLSRSRTGRRHKAGHVPRFVALPQAHCKSAVPMGDANKPIGCGNETVGAKRRFSPLFSSILHSAISLHLFLSHKNISRAFKMEVLPRQVPFIATSTSQVHWKSAFPKGDVKQSSVDPSTSIKDLKITCSTSPANP